MKAFPLFITTSEKAIAIFGGGADAAAKLRLVLKTDADIYVIASELTDEIALGHAQWIKMDPLDYTIPQNLAFAYAATGDEALDANIAIHVRGQGGLICAADQPEVSDFSTPAIVDRDPLVIAIGSEGTAPMLTRQVKSDLETALEPHLGKISAFAGQLRGKIARMLPSGRIRREFWRQFFNEARKSAPLNFKAANRLANRLITDETAQKGHVIIAGAGPGDPELLTIKARKALYNADVVLYDALVSPDILELTRREAITISVGKRCGAHSARQEDIQNLMIKYARDGMMVVRLKGGDPAIFSRLGEELDALDYVGVDYTVIPGITTASAASALVAAPLTERDLAPQMHMISAHDKFGFAHLDWASLANNDAPISIYMGKKQAKLIQQHLIENGKSSDTPVELLANATTRQQESLHTTLKTLPDAVAALPEEAPVIMIIGARARQPGIEFSLTSNTTQNTQISYEEVHHVA